MAALSAARVTKSRNLGDTREYATNGNVIYAGGIVMIGSDGYADAAAAQANNNGCVGVALETVGASDTVVKVQEGDFLFAGDTLQQEDVGHLCYADDDQTIDETQATNAPVAGILVELVSASEGWVKISQATSGAA
jgi:hypothetical protein